jgi:hypothetical protein
MPSSIGIQRPSAKIGLPGIDFQAHGLCNQLPNMLYDRVDSRTMAHPADIHRATGIVADGGRGLGFRNAVNFILDDRAADGGVFDGKCPAETAALIGLFHRAEIDISDLIEKSNSLIFNADPAEVAGVVIRHRAALRQRELRQINLENLFQKFDEFVSAGDDFVHAVLVCMVVGKKMRKMLADHRAATAAGGDDVIIFLERLDEITSQRRRLGMKPVVEERLAAAGLGSGEMHDTTEMLEDFSDRNPDARIELIVQARDEKGDVASHGKCCFA